MHAIQHRQQDSVLLVGPEFVLQPPHLPRQSFFGQFRFLFQQSLGLMDRGESGCQRGLPRGRVVGQLPTLLAQTLCLSNNRYQVRTTWRNQNGQNGNGTAVRLTADTGYFWFFSSTNVEMVVKVLNACSLNSRFWVFAGGLTNVQVTTTVTDTQTGQVKVYNNNLNQPFLPLQDTGAFATCP